MKSVDDLTNGDVTMSLDKKVNIVRISVIPNFKYSLFSFQKKKKKRFPKELNEVVLKCTCTMKGQELSRSFWRTTKRILPVHRSKHIPSVYYLRQGHRDNQIDQSNGKENGGQSPQPWKPVRVCRKWQPWLGRGHDRSPEEEGPQQMLLRWRMIGIEAVLQVAHKIKFQLDQN